MDACNSDKEEEIEVRGRRGRSKIRSKEGKGKKKAESSDRNSKSSSSPKTKSCKDGAGKDSSKSPASITPMGGAGGGGTVRRHGSMSPTLASLRTPSSSSALRTASSSISSPHLLGGRSPALRPHPHSPLSGSPLLRPKSFASPLGGSPLTALKTSPLSPLSVPRHHTPPLAGESTTPSPKKGFQATHGPVERLLAEEGLHSLRSFHERGRSGSGGHQDMSAGGGGEDEEGILNVAPRARGASPSGSGAASRKEGNPSPKGASFDAASSSSTTLRSRNSPSPARGASGSFDAGNASLRDPPQGRRVSLDLLPRQSVAGSDNRVGAPLGRVRRLSLDIEAGRNAQEGVDGSEAAEKVLPRFMQMTLTRGLKALADGNDQSTAKHLEHLKGGHPDDASAPSALRKSTDVCPFSISGAEQKLLKRMELVSQLGIVESEDGLPVPLAPRFDPEGINSNVSFEKGNSSITRNSSGFGGIFTARGPFFTLLPEDLFPAMVEESSDGDAGGDGEGEGVDDAGERSREVWNVDAVIRKLPPSYLVPKVPEYFTFVVESCVDAHLFVGIAAEDADMSDTLGSPDMVTYRSNGLFRVFDEKKTCYNVETSMSVPRYGTGDVITIYHFPIPGLFIFYKNSRKIGEVNAVKRRMRPFVGMGTKGQSVSTGVGMIRKGKVAGNCCQSCFAVMGLEQKEFNCRQGGDMRYKETVKGGKKKKEGASDGKQGFDFDALPGEGGQTKAWGAWTRLCCNCVRNWSNCAVKPDGGSQWYSRWGCRPCRLRIGDRTLGGKGEPIPQQPSKDQDFDDGSRRSWTKTLSEGVELEWSKGPKFQDYSSVSNFQMRRVGNTSLR